MASTGVFVRGVCALKRPISCLYTTRSMSYEGFRVEPSLKSNSPCSKNPAKDFCSGDLDGVCRRSSFVHWGWPLFRRERAKFFSLFRWERGEISRKFRGNFEISLTFR